MSVSSFIKKANTAYARAIGKNLLSATSKQRLANFLPTGVTRQTSRDVIGKGDEGMVLPSFTGGGVGDSVTKVFTNLARYPQLHDPKYIMRRAQVMRARPDIFPHVWSVSPRSITMEPLQELDPSAGGKLWHNIRHRAELKSQLESKRHALASYSHLKKIPKILRPFQSKQFAALKAKEDAYKHLRDMYWQSGKEIRQSPVYPILQFSHGGIPKKEPYAFMGDVMGDAVTDFSVHPGGVHNIMKRPNGSAVISDPMVTPDFYKYAASSVGRGLVSLYAAAILQSAGTHATSSLSRSGDKDVDRTKDPVRDHLLNRMESRGTKMLTEEDLVAAGLLSPNSTSSIENAFYAPKQRGIYLGKNYKGNSTLAHEIGHSEDPAILTKANIAGKSVGLLGTLLAATLRPQAAARLAAKLGTVGYGGTLASETSASLRGYKIMGEAGEQDFGQRLKAAGGLPSYMLAALMPAITYKGRKLLGAFK